MVLGNSDKNWPFIIQNFIVTSKRNDEEKIFESSQQKPIIQNLNLPEDFSYPLIDQLELPSEQLNLKLS